MTVTKLMLMALGWICIALGVIGIFLPVMPTTVFLLAAAWCFARSSERLHRKLIEHPHLGPLILAWQAGDGLPRPLRNRILLTLWAGMSGSALLLQDWLIAAILFTIASAVSIYLLRLPCRES